MHVENTLTIPGPILSRFYQEMSNGMLGFNQAFKASSWLQVVCRRLGRKKPNVLDFENITLSILV